MHGQLRQWYDAHGRKELPWRNTNDPYHIYVSEIMLQQTQVATVLERYYHPFLRQFPGLPALAAAPEDAVMKAWEGLGYYSRAANMHRTARQAGHRLPETVEQLMELPGIGRNTAHAIAAFAYRQPVPVLEANVKRIIHRLMAWEQATDTQRWQAAETLLNREDPFTYNQAMMDVGAMVCRPKSPDCPACPLSTICKGKDAPERYPQQRQKKPTPVRKRILLVCQSADGAVYLEKSTGRFLKGLYQFPQYPLQETRFTINNRAYAKAQTQRLGNITQTYSHFRLEAEIRMLEVASVPTHTEGWFALKTLAALPLSKADQKAVRFLEILHKKKQNVSSGSGF